MTTAQKTRSATRSRVGSFSIPFQKVETFDTTAKRIMGLCIVVRAESNYIRGEIDYIAISEHFRSLKEGEVTPAYIWHASGSGEIWAIEQKPNTN